MCPKNIKEKTMKRFRKSTALLLAVLMLSGSMYSCSETQNETKETESAPLLNRESESESAEEETVDERLSPCLEILDLEERKFRIYGCPPNEGGDWHVHDMISEELTGEAVNDAMYDRNLFLEDTYKFGIELTESTGNVQQEIVNLVSAGDESYSVCGVTVRTAANLSVDGNTYDLTKLKYIDLSQPYWTPSLNDPLTVEGRLFMASGDISVVPREAIRAFYFNKDLQHPACGVCEQVRQDVLPVPDGHKARSSRYIPYRVSDDEAERDSRSSWILRRVSSQQGFQEEIRSFTDTIPKKQKIG